ncbi:MAG: nucleotidyltransferase domain-containing protein [Anaerolineae bacterium]|jgi:predicted nucleotidyltransferase|nr:nucleotidyltransferase domain-containing protein [Anaerolineae bacterium]
MNRHFLSSLSEQEQCAIEVFLERVRQAHPQRVKQVRLFGSKARGDSHAGSDIDILLIVDEEDWRFRHAISDIAADVSLAHDVLIEPRVIGQARWDEMRRHHFALYENVQAEGVGLVSARSA